MNAIDSEDGIKYMNGDIYIDNQLQEIENGEYKEIGNNFDNKQFNPMLNNNDDFNIKDFKEKVNNLPEDATIQDVLEILEMNDYRDDIKPFENEPPMDMPKDDRFKDKLPFNNSETQN